MVEGRCVHAASRLTSIEFYFDSCTFTAIVPGTYTGEAKMCKNVLNFRLELLGNG